MSQAFCVNPPLTNGVVNLEAKCILLTKHLINDSNAIYIMPRKIKVFSSVDRRSNLTD